MSRTPVSFSLTLAARGKRTSDLLAITAYGATGSGPYGSMWRRTLDLDTDSTSTTTERLRAAAVAILLSTGGLP